MMAVPIQVAEQVSIILYISLIIVYSNRISAAAKQIIKVRIIIVLTNGTPSPLSSPPFTGERGG
ncbi:MAG: hypothetical protein COZ32_04650 [Nitrospirae bacterium CG_4_10_14_3_um_filter_53_41]|nr:MAG: hypothetical protein COW52_12385 [Nitrospirae bacterium CG17_big_fil_post_rev_8_21_14_2_50_50_9]PIX86190.1 MAG: hypothetical protein COZ32_04650 [Nitrospirae bacterium CG_4_10_14_3_um_filter_53_41]